MNYYELFKLWANSKDDLSIEFVSEQNNITDAKTISDACVFCLNIIQKGFNPKNKERLECKTAEEYLNSVEEKLNDRKKQSQIDWCGNSIARKVFVKRIPKNKKEKSYFDKIEILTDVVEKYYNKNLFKKEGLINISHREYKTNKGSLKEGMAVKFAPYMNCVIVNVYGIKGDSTFDVNEQKLYGGKQCSLLFRFNKIPSKNEIIDYIISYDILIQQNPIGIEQTDITRHNIYPTAEQFFNENKNYIPQNVFKNAL